MRTNFGHAFLLLASRTVKNTKHRNIFLTIGILTIIEIRPLQDVDFYLIYLLNKHKGHGSELGRPR